MREGSRNDRHMEQVSVRRSMAPWMFNAHAVVHSVLLLLGVARGWTPRSWAIARTNEREPAFALMCKSTDGNILVTFPMALMSTLIKAVWGRKVSFSSQFQRTFILAGRAWQRKLEAPDHILLAVRKERAMDGYAQLAVPFSFGPGCMPVHGMLLPTLKVLPTVNSI